jgi:hypothetical protein
MPLWLAILKVPCMAVYLAWFWAGIFRFNLVKGTRREVLLRAFMNELRPFMWPCFTVSRFASLIEYIHKPHTDWWDWPVWILLLVLDVLILLFYYYVRYKDDDDDDRWTKRRKRVASKISSRLTLPRPASHRV